MIGERNRKDTNIDEYRFCDICSVVWKEMCLYAINARDGFLSFFVHYSPWISSPTNLVYVFKEYGKNKKSMDLRNNVGCAEEQLSEKISERKIFRSSYGTLRKDRVAAGEFFGEIEGKPHNFYTMEYVVPIQQDLKNKVNC